MLSELSVLLLLTSHSYTTVGTALAVAIASVAWLCTRASWAAGGRKRHGHIRGGGRHGQGSGRHQWPELHTAAAAAAAGSPQSSQHSSHAGR